MSLVALCSRAPKGYHIRTHASKEEAAMRQRVLLGALIASLAVPIAAQVQPGWKVRIDGSPAASTPDAGPTLKFAPAGKGFHVTGGPGAIFWDPAHTVKGVYSVKA